MAPFRPINPKEPSITVSEFNRLMRSAHGVQRSQVANGIVSRHGVLIAEPRLQAAVEMPFMVLVAKDAGVSGGAAAECTWTYTVYDLNGLPLMKNLTGDAATGMTPQQPRNHYVGYYHAGQVHASKDAPYNIATSSLALACRLTQNAMPLATDLMGDLRLLICYGEIIKEGTC